MPLLEKASVEEEPTLHELGMTDLGRAFVEACNPDIAGEPVAKRDEL